MRSSEFIGIRRYRTIEPSVHGGGSVRVKIRRELLNPAGKDIIGLLHLNGTRIFIPKDRQITIGSAKDCDIRINDRLIEGHQIVLTPQGNGFEISNFSIARKLAVKKEGSKEISLIEKGIFGTLELTESARIYLELSGIGANSQKRLLEIKLEIPQLEVTNAIQKLLETRPDIVEVSPEQIQAKTSGQEGKHKLLKIAPEILASTDFSNGNCLEDVIDIYGTKSAKLVKEVNLDTNGGIISGGISIIGIISAGIIGVSLPLFFLLASALAVGGFLNMCVFGAFKIKNEKAQEKLEKEFIKVLTRLNPEDIAKVLESRDVNVIKKVLMILIKENNRIANEVNRHLFTHRQVNQPPQLEAPKS